MYFVAVIAYAQLGYSISDSHYFLTSAIFLVRILSIRLTRKYDINESKCNILFNTSTRIITLLNYTIVEPPIVSICRYLWGSWSETKRKRDISDPPTIFRLQYSMKDKNQLFIFLTRSRLKLSAGISYKAKKTWLELNRTNKTCKLNSTECEKTIFRHRESNPGLLGESQLS